MSIYGTLISFDQIFGWDDPPIVYRGSHILPSETDERGGEFECAEIGGWITRDGRDNGPNEDKPWPYMRVSAGPHFESVVLTRAQVAQVYGVLGDWLERTA